MIDVHDILNLTHLGNMDNEAGDTLCKHMNVCD